jgi:hypothetical protein
MRSVLSIVRRPEKAASILEELRAQGFGGSEVSVVAPVKQAGRPPKFAEEQLLANENSCLGVSDVIKGWLISPGMIHLPCGELLLSAGPVAEMLLESSESASGKSPDSLSVVLTRLGLPLSESARYEGKIRRMSILIVVHSNEPRRSLLAMKLLDENDAHDLVITTECGMEAEEALKVE